MADHTDGSRIHRYLSRSPGRAFEARQFSLLLVGPFTFTDGKTGSSMLDFAFLDIGQVRLLLSKLMCYEYEC